MKLIVLGCNGPYPAPGGACSGYLLESDDQKTCLVIDFGSGTLANLPRIIEYEKPDAVVLTHLHYDHMSDMLPLRYALQFHPRAEKLPVFAPSTPEAAYETLKADAFELRPQEDAQIGSFSLRFMRVRHPVETCAIRVEENGKAFVFTGDTNECPGLSDFCRNADLLLADAGFAEADWAYEKPHLSALRCAFLARSAGAKKLVLTHFNPKYEVDDLLVEALAAFENADVASVGRSFVI